MKVHVLFWTAAAMVFGGLLFPETKDAAVPQKAPREFSVDLARALDARIPAGMSPGARRQFTTPDGRRGWVVRMPEAQSIPTPTVANGKVLVGGGFGSADFFAFDAETGDLAWKSHNTDPGPTAAVAEDGYVCYNTESCCLCVVEISTGRIVWQQWLASTLLSQPAIWKGRIYTVFPSGTRPAPASAAPSSSAPSNAPAFTSAAPFSYGPHRRSSSPPPATPPPQPPPPPQAAAPATGPAYKIICADLRTGRRLWEKAVPEEVLSAPVIDDGKVYLACMDGTSFCLNAEDGREEWQRRSDATSAPVVVEGDVVQSRNVASGRGWLEFSRLELPPAARPMETWPHTASRGFVSMPWEDMVMPPGYRAELPQIEAEDRSRKQKLLTFAGASTPWSYEGPRPAYFAGRILGAKGNTFNCVDASDGSVLWRASAAGTDRRSRTFSTPALGRENAYLTSVSGRLLALRQDTGKPVFGYNLGHPVEFQPALSGGRVFIGTADGYLICIETGSDDADGWTCWGGNARHNKTE